MKKDTFTLNCETCGHNWDQKCDGIGNINWKCPKCKNDEETFLTHYEPGDPDFNKRKLEMGRGGALSAHW